MTKPRKLRNWLRNNIKECEIIIYYDAYDVVFVDSPEEIVWKFGMIGKDIIWNAEKSLFPDATLVFPECSTSYKYLNSGFAVGYAEAFLEMLEWMNLDEIPDDHRKPDGTMFEPNDQFYVQKAFLDSPISMGLDTECNTCQTLCGVEQNELDFTRDKIMNKETYCFPSAFHFNGPSKTAVIRRPILEKLSPSWK